MFAGLFTCLLSGLPPAILGSRPSILGVLRLDSRSSAGSTSARRLRSGLVIAEVTVAIVLLVGAALMARSYLKLQSVDRGFDTNGLISLRLGFPTGSYNDAGGDESGSRQPVARAITLVMSLISFALTLASLMPRVRTTSTYGRAV